jgi:hypothetical protein
MEKLHGRASNETKLVARTAREQLKSVAPRKPASLSTRDVIAAFGGKSLQMKVGDVTAPVTLLTIRDALMDRLRSTGGRPALSGEGSRQRVQVSPDDWERIMDIARHVEVGRHKPSPAQVASVLIHLALERVTLGEIGRLVDMDIED